jgi:pyruvate dehydrogenase E2 component (dihydrolipoamide acetyltransferase)
MIVNLAAKAGVDLARIAGTGPGGQITRDDVNKAASAGAAAIAPRRPLSRNQIAVAKTVAASWRDTVPIHLWATVRMDRAIALREFADGGRRPAFDAIFIHAASRVMPDFPDFGCAFGGDALIPAGGVHIALAVSGAEGLVLPVVRDADRKSLAAIDAEVRGFADRNSALGPGTGDFGGATFTISNLGMMPIDAFTAIIPPGQAAILTAGRVKEDRSAQFVLTVDHRFINGREAASFLSRFKEVLESL